MKGDASLATPPTTSRSTSVLSVVAVAAGVEVRQTTVACQPSLAEEGSDSWVENDGSNSACSKGDPITTELIVVCVRISSEQLNTVLVLK